MSLSFSPRKCHRYGHGIVISHIIRKKKRLRLLRRLTFCTRYIDDLWNPLVPSREFQRIAKQIYPSWLKLGLEHQATEINYLDMTIWHTQSNPVEWHSRLYDKKIAMIAKGLKLNKFPHPASKLSERCKYGVITSQLHRYNVACTPMTFSTVLPSA